MRFEKIKYYAQLMRLDRPIGIWLLLWPTLWALWIAGQGHPSFSLVLIFITGTFLMRSAGCVINDIADRHVDKFVTRTKNRPLTSGKVSLTGALLLFICLLMLAASLLLWLNALARELAVVGAMLAILYPFTKRWTYWPQIVFALTWSMGVPMAYAAQTHALPVDCWIIYFTNALWSFMYDTQYAMADREDDLKIGIKSSAIALGKYDKFVLSVLQIMVSGLLIYLGILLKFSWIYFISVVVVMGLFIYQRYLIHKRQPAQCLKAFLNNQWVGMVIFLGIALSYVLASV